MKFVPNKSVSLFPQMFHPSFYMFTRNMSGEQLADLLEEWSHVVSEDIVANYRLGVRGITSYKLLMQATTFRQRVFARAFRYLKETTKPGTIRVALSNGWDIQTFVVDVEKYSAPIDVLMSACYEVKEIRDFLSKIKLINPPMDIYADVEISHMLQELADAVAQEATNAFKEDYYPGIPDVDVSDKHVHKVMIAMQREIDREAARVGKRPTVFVDLPIERQRALAERRRWWFAKFGITPASWRTGKFSLWKISDEKIADYNWINFNN